MQLGQYLKEEGLTVATFARDIGISAEAVRLYVTGQRRPRAAVIDRIRDKTHGKVRAGDFFGESEDEEAAAQ